MAKVKMHCKNMCALERTQGNPRGKTIQVKRSDSAQGLERELFLLSSPRELTHILPRGKKKKIAYKAPLWGTGNNHRQTLHNSAVCTLY